MTHRIERVNHLIRQEISEMLERQVKDPRLGGFVIVTEVKTTHDLKHARVFVSQAGNEGDRQQIINALTAAAGFLRTELSRKLRMRHVPDLSFQWDDSIERGAHILELIDRLNVKKETKPGE